MNAYTDLVEYKENKGWRRLFAFIGPAFLVSVGYMDPGNWATDIAGGSMYQYQLIWILLLSNLMAIVLQSLSARMGIVTRYDLAQANRLTYPKRLNHILWFLAEIAIISTDLAEIIGMAIGLKLLFGLSLTIGVLITVFDTFLLIYLQKLGMRKMEAFIISLIVIIAVSFLVQLTIADVDLLQISTGFVPHALSQSQLLIAIGIIGATVMPHNLYLHSAIIQSRKIKRTEEGIKSAIKFSLIDSTIALNIAFFVNAAILILAGTVFYKSGFHEITGIEQAHQLLEPILGSRLAPILFAIALIAAGQSSTITGTISGQIVMEGYLNLRMNPILRRFLTRALAIVPAIVVIQIAGDKRLDELLVWSQVILSFQLAFAVIPLIIFVSSKKRMGVFAIGIKTKIVSWLIALIILSLNIKYVGQLFYELTESANSIWITILLFGIAVFFLVIMFLMFYYPLIKNQNKENINHHRAVAEITQTRSAGIGFKCILVPLDFSKADEKVLSYAIKQSNSQTQLILLHVVESPVSTLLGANLDVDEMEKDKAMLINYQSQLEKMGISTKVKLKIGFRVKSIVEAVKENQIDLIIMGAHRHKQIKDMVYGETINKVRHEVDVPILIV